MDFSEAPQPLFNYLWLLIPLAILSALVKSRWFKGWVGECMVNISAHLFLDKKTYHLIRNVTLPTEDGTTQIDHIIVSPFGVFVVETKNMKGWIFGRARQPQWTQKIYRHTQKFQNPLHQNYKHVKTLQALLGLGDGEIHSVVVFVGDATFKTEMPANVTQGRGYLRYIKSHQIRLLTPEQMDEVVERIKAGRLAASLRTHRNHVRHVQEIVAGKQTDFGFGGATEQDRLVYPLKSRRRGGSLQFKLVMFVALIAFGVSGAPVELSKWFGAKASHSIQANVLDRPPITQQPRQPTLEAERLRWEAEERARLAADQRAKERAFERAFYEQYVAPDGCDNWKSERHMVECVNHGMRAKARFRDEFFGG